MLENENDYLHKLLQESKSLSELVKNVDSLYVPLVPSSHECSALVKISKESGRIVQVVLQEERKKTWDEPNVIDLQLVSQLEHFLDCPDVAMFVRPDFRRLRVTLRDDADRMHTAMIDRKSIDQYIIAETSILHSAYQDVVYTCPVKAVDAFRATVASLQDYFRELERIDSLCWVVDPPKPTFKDDYRRIVLEERAWLHVEVSPEGVAARLRAVGGGAAAAAWAERLAEGLRAWRPERGVLHNVMCILDIDEFPQQPIVEGSATPDVLECSICLCSELPEVRSTFPEPLCPNTKCGSYYHTGCLFQWLVASGGGAAPRLGVASGKCPNCLGTISCSESGV